MNKQIVGFDFGAKTLKMAEYAGGEVKKAVCVEIPDNLMSEGKILSMDAMAAFIQMSAKENGISKGNAAMVIPPKEVFVRNITVPAMSDQQMALNLPFEFKDYLTQSKTDYVFDYVVHEIMDGEDANPQMRLTVCAALKSDIEQYRAMFKRAGFALKVAVPEEIAMSNVLARYFARNPNVPKSLCLIDMGHEETRVHMYFGAEPVTKTTIGLGGKKMDELIADEQGVDIYTAANLKVTNFNRVLNTSRVVSTIHSLSQDFMKTLHFYNYNHRDSDVSEIYLLGGGSAIDPIRREFKTASGLPVRGASVLLGKSEEVSDSELYMMACGCAMNEE